MRIKPPAIAVFDIGKTNRKVAVFDEGYRMLDIRFLPSEATLDDEGHPTLHIDSLRGQLLSTVDALLSDPRWQLKAVNFTTYGATMVWLDEDGLPTHPVVDYLNPFPEEYRLSFEEEHGPIATLCMRTASPFLGNLNAGLQLYALKKRDPNRFRDIRHAVYLPQFLSSLLTGRLFTEATGIGCHTLTWDFGRSDYADWVRKEGIDILFPEMRRADDAVLTEINGTKLFVGIGLHDSSSALIPYLKSVSEPFLLLSTGTWSICLNPFDGGVLKQEELEADCLNYLRYDGGVVKASRMPLGLVHDAMVESLCRLYEVSPDCFHDMPWNEDVCSDAEDRRQGATNDDGGYDPSLWNGPVEAYHALLHHLMMLQKDRVRRVFSRDIGSMYVDGGFSRNRIFQRMLAKALPELRVFASDVGQSTALGAAIVLHRHWNPSVIPDGLIRFTPL